MDAESFEKKEDGWNLIVELEYSLEHIKDYINKSCLKENEKVQEILADINEPTDENVEKFCAELITFLNNDLSLDELTILFVVACMAYTLEGASVETIECRTNLLYGVFFQTDTLCPQHIHVAVERIWEGLKINEDTVYVLNVVSLCREIATVNPTGKAISICLAWAILCEITETEAEMYCFHEFSEINTMLKEIDEDILRQDEYTQIIYILIQIVGFLINSIVFSTNEEFLKSGFRHYFVYKREDLENLKEWAEQLAIFLGAGNVKPSNFWDLRMSMTEYIKLNIVSLLYDKIKDMDE